MRLYSALGIACGLIGLQFLGRGMLGPSLVAGALVLGFTLAASLASTTERGSQF